MSMPRSNDRVDTSSNRQAPSNEQAELALLGALLGNNKTYETVSDFLLPEHFSDPANGKVYAAIARHIDAGRVVDGVLLKNECDPARIAKCLASMVGYIMAVDYAQEIYNTWIKRKLIEVGDDIVAQAFAGEMDAADQLDAAEQALYAVADKGGSDEAVNLADAMVAAVNEGEAYARGESAAYISTGFQSLDKVVIGLGAGHLMIGAGRPGMGKSAIAKNIAINVAKEGHSVAFFQLEETTTDFGASALAIEAQVEMRTVNTGALSNDEASRVVEATGRMRQVTIKLYDKPHQSLLEIARRARRMKRRDPKLRLIVVDYLQLMADVPGYDKRLSVGANANGLKTLAKKLDCSVILLSQLSRAVENRPDKRPQLSDLRESGEIEDSADIVALMYREEYYERQKPVGISADDMPEAREAKQREWEENVNRVTGTAEVNIAKNRRGEPGVVTMSFEGKHLKFGDLT